MPDISSVDNKKALQVLDAATSVFLTHGFSAATTDMIQRKARVSKSTMYACFSNKEAMFAAVVERECSAMASTIKAIDTAPGNIAGMLTEIGMSYLNIVLSPSGLALYRVAVAEAPRFAELGRLFYQAGPKIVTGLVIDRLNEALKSGEIDVQSTGVEGAAALFISMVRGEGQLEALTHPESRPSVAQLEQWVDRAVKVFLAAFAPGKNQ
ncbi:TetR/AcrR family transcriptional regulator [Brenneria populi]|uniref:TetR/AcrR family transcriptional regulator n=1 Tax=Brenneria populi TaxID=1505588 RepID=A0ABU6JQT9_9GAMM|nr:TetR/AcrR family transcriptional regulator [Brenneria populi Li et al. 2015]